MRYNWHFLSFIGSATSLKSRLSVNLNETGINYPYLFYKPQNNDVPWIILCLRLIVGLELYFVFTCSSKLYLIATSNSCRFFSFHSLLILERT